MSVVGSRFVAHSAMLIAGLMCVPETFPNAYTRTMMGSPKARLRTSHAAMSMPLLKSLPAGVPIPCDQEQRRHDDAAAHEHEERSTEELSPCTVLADQFQP